MSTEQYSCRSRRAFLYGLGSSIGAVALSSLLGCKSSPELVSEALRHSGDPLTAKPPMSLAKAKACIFLSMEGGPSHIDTFDPKPALEQYHLKKFERKGEKFSAMSSGRRYIVQSPFQSRKVGESGADMCDRFVHLVDVADDMCFYRGLQAESVNHPTAMYHINTGNKFGGEPALGSWVTYGLGTINENVPAFVVLPELAWPQGGSGNWSNGFLPAHYQGTPFRPIGAPVLNIDPPPGVSHYHQRESLDLLDQLNKDHFERNPHHEELEARMSSYELAFRMQAEVPDLIDIEGEPEHIRKMYGIGQEATDAFGRKCLMARKLIEQGVRFVQAYSGGWDSHDFLARAHGNLIQSIDKPITGLIKDLKQRGLLDETVIVWCGEFGRTPDNGFREGGVAYGRDHNPDAMAFWMAGGGVNAGHTIGATDELGEKAVEVVHPIGDLHVTLLKLLGLDDHNLTYFHSGRHKQLSQFGGKVITDLIA
ncbi:MAG: DUF1501 domain-containing protein [Saprospiraceae bacterium]|nr:DUF1501 domain-containing protein [Saprospiraceae bacterium]